MNMALIKTPSIISFRQKKIYGSNEGNREGERVGRCTARDFPWVTMTKLSASETLRRELPVCGTDIQHAAKCNPWASSHSNLKCSYSWMCHFKKHHCIINKATVGGLLCADTGAAEYVWTGSGSLKEQEGFQVSQVDSVVTLLYGTYTINVFCTCMTKSHNLKIELFLVLEVFIPINK